MTRLIGLLMLACCVAGAARASEEVVIIRGNFPQLLARGETTVQMAQRIAVLIGGLDRRIAPPCGMKRFFEFAGADYVDMNDISRRLDPGQAGVWRIVVTGKGCWSARTHNVFLFGRGASPASLRLGVPGRSVAGVKHQQDATQIVLRQANGIVMSGNCEGRAFIVEAAVVHPRLPGKSWDEMWSASACEFVRKYSVKFQPQDDGKMRISVVPVD
ncbi:MAG: hypothetical protein K8S25_14215 [Alphaproteobacteria bacterium]|nr:hypothetical protein [Alphaproteobacteria bacterium]